MVLNGLFLVTVGVCIGKLWDTISKNFNSLKTLYAVTYRFTPNRLKTIFKMISTIIKIQYETFYTAHMKYIKRSTILDTHTFEIDYYHKGAYYKIKFLEDKSGPLSLNISDENNIDVTNKLHVYIGPNHDFHGQYYTPASLGYNKLTIYDSDLNKFEFERSDVINLPR